jgi:hypothetical protein
MESLEAADAITRPTLFQCLGRKRLTWFPDLGVGYFPVEDPQAPYDVRYFAKYMGYQATDMGRRITQARLELVERHWQGPLVDVGIGSGAFVSARPNTKGYDINPCGVYWLKDKELFCDPYREPVEAVSLWDVLEHIAEFDKLLARVTARVFVSLPVFTGPHEVLSSRHYREDEHFWYFSAYGFLKIMATLGWQALEHNEAETRIGREGIASFAFARAP